MRLRRHSHVVLRGWSLLATWLKTSGSSPHRTLVARTASSAMKRAKRSVGRVGPSRRSDQVPTKRQASNIHSQCLRCPSPENTAARSHINTQRSLYFFTMRKRCHHCRHLWIKCPARSCLVHEAPAMYRPRVGHGIISWCNSDTVRGLDAFP